MANPWQNKWTILNACIIILVLFALLFISSDTIGEFKMDILSLEKEKGNFLNFQQENIENQVIIKNINYSHIPLSSLNNTFEYDGYIIEFYEEPLSKKYVQLTSDLKVDKSNRDFIKTELALTEKKIDKSHEQIRNDMLNKFPNIKIKKEFKRVFNGMFIDATPTEIEDIRKLSYVKNVYPNTKVEAVLFDSVPLINADDVWQFIDDLNRSVTGQGVTIAIIDTGIDYTHPDLGGCFGPECKVVGGWDFVHNDPDPMDDHGHGTHCASIAAGNGVIKGVAPDAKLYAYMLIRF